MICRKCGLEVPAGPFCAQCGAKQAVRAQSHKHRGNGQGTVYKLKNGTYIAVKTLGYHLDENGKKHRDTVSKVFHKKKDAVEALPTLGAGSSQKAEKKAATTLLQLYNKWLPTHNAGKSTLNCYKAAMKHYAPLWHVKLQDIDVDDLQECVDECTKGKSTRRNMRTVMGLLYKYGIPRAYFPEKLNLADYLSVTGEAGTGGTSLPDKYLEKIHKAVGKVAGANYVYAQCYLGFRPSEFLALDVESYDKDQKAFVGGAKTDAGKDRIVTVSPKIQGIIDDLTAGRDSGPIFADRNGERLLIRDYRAMFYKLLDELGLENPTFEVAGKQRHTYTPHSCRHTFATLMKRVAGSDKDKLELIGHTSTEQLMYYQDVNLEDLRKITDQI